MGPLRNMYLWLRIVTICPLDNHFSSGLQYLGSSPVFMCVCSTAAFYKQEGLVFQV